MKLTIRQLKKIIREGSFAGGPLYEVDASYLLEFARAFAGFDEFVQRNLEALLNGDHDDFAENGINPKALKLIEERIGGMNEEIDTAITAYKEWLRDYELENNNETEPEDDEDDDGTWRSAAKINKL